MRRTTFSESMLLAMALVTLGACHKNADAPRGVTGVGSAAVPEVAASAPPLSEAPPPTPPEAQRTSSGLASVMLTPGSGGPRPAEYDLVYFRSTGVTASGGTFAATGDEPVMTRVRDISPPGLSEGLRLMTVGEKRRIFIPASLGYDKKGQEAGYPAGNLAMDVELTQIVSTPHPPAAPSDARSQAGARPGASGMRYRFLAPPSKTAKKPSADSFVAYNYTLWTDAGVLVDSSFPDARPTSSRLAELDPRWREALSMMGAGDKLRMWLTNAPTSGAADANAPAGSFVADVEMVYVYDVASRTPTFASNKR